MLYATVVVNRPTDTAFTYTVTPAQVLSLAVGSLVEVPLGPKAALGVVWRLSRRRPHEVTSKFKSLHRVLSDRVWAPPATRKLAEALAKHSGQSLGSCLFRILPPPGKRHIVGLADEPYQRGLRLHVLGPRSQRFAQYRSLIGRAHAAGRSTILVAPLAFHESLVTVLGQAPLFRITGELAHTAQRSIFADFQHQPGSVLLSTRHVVGWPCPTLGQVIIDDVLHPSHADDQRPYLDSAMLAEIRQHMTGGHLVLGSGLPSPAMALAEINGIAQVLPRDTSWHRHAHLTSARSLSQLLASQPPADEPGLVIAPRHGLGGTLSCADCQAVARCSRCQGEVQAEPHGQIHCADCQQREPAPSVCQTCGGHQLVASGIGQDSLRRQLDPDAWQVETEQIVDETTTWPRIVFAYADSPLLSPSLDRVFRYLSRIVEAAGLTQHVTVQTNHPQHPLWRYLLARSTADYEPFLAERRRHGLTPFQTVNQTE